MRTRYEGVTPAAGVSAFDSLALFTFLWAVAVLTHQAYFRQFLLLNWHDVLLIAVACAALVRPSSLIRLTALCAAHLVEVAIEMPLVGNHWLLAGLGSLTILTVLAFRPGRRQDGSWDRARLYNAMAPPLRLMLILVYGFAFMAKLNRDFLDPSLSCATVLYGLVADRVAILPTSSWVYAPVVWTTVAVEASLPLLLAFRRTRVAGVLLAVPFHLALGLADHYDFSAVAVAFLVLFLPDDLPTRLRALVSGVPVARTLSVRIGRASRSPLAVPLSIAVAYGVMTQVSRVVPMFVFAMTVWFIGTLAMLVVLVVTMRQGAGAPSQSHLAVRRAPWLLGPVLVICHALSPYVGLKTEHSFTMFSNLMTEGEYWNHLFLPQSIRVFGMQDEIYRIIDSSEPRIRRYAERRRPLVRYSFQWLVSHYPSASVVYEHGGGRYEVARIGDHAMLSQRPAGGLLAKVLNFRVVRPTCGH